jgi:hypothetical protein
MSLESERKRWENKTLAPANQRFPERKKEFRTPSGIPLPPVLAPLDSERASLHSRCSAIHVSRPVLDHAPVRRLCIRE